MEDSDICRISLLASESLEFLQINMQCSCCIYMTLSGATHRGAATDSGPPGQHIHSAPPAFRGGVIHYRNRDCVPEPVFFSPSPKSDYTVSAIKIVQFCM